MRVVSKARLKEFGELPGHEDTEGLLRAWYTRVNSKTISWQTWGDVKTSFAGASIVGELIVFNIGGNKHALISRIRYATQQIWKWSCKTGSPALSVIEHSSRRRGPRFPGDFRALWTSQGPISSKVREDQFYASISRHLTGDGRQPRRSLCGIDLFTNCMPVYHRTSCRCGRSLTSIPSLSQTRPSRACFASFSPTPFTSNTA
jgi:mRNA interferase HigB